MRIDRSNQLKFASLQGETAAKEIGVTKETIDPDTIVYLREGKKFERSTAVLKILSDVGGPWSLARLLLIIPKFVRDAAYNLIAKNRYRFIKKRETCRMPTASERERLLP